MTNALLETRVTGLETLMADLIHVSFRTQRNVDQLTDEMRAFQGEMADFKEEMRDFKDQTEKDRREFNK